MASRYSAVAAVALLAPIASARQGESPLPKGSLFKIARPEATIVIRRHPTGANLVEITVARPDYSPETLRSAARRLGDLVGTPARGLLVASSTGFLKATFATNGLIGPSGDPEGRLKLAPIIRALGFAPDPLRSLAVLYADVPADATTVKSYRDPAGRLRVEAERLPGGVEYRTLVSPALAESEVVLPGPRGIAAPAPRPLPPPRDWTLPIALGIGAAAAGGLVYSVVARRPGKPRGPRRG